MPADFARAARQAAHPPIREVGFWVVQLMVATIAGLHLLVDVKFEVATSTFPAGIPVTLLIVPVGYAALRYGLAGSASTEISAVFLWLPDLLLPPKQGHIGGDLVDLGWPGPARVSSFKQLACLRPGQLSRGARPLKTCHDHHSYSRGALRLAA
jgi:hypothetical protein